MKQPNVPVFLIYAGIIHAIGLALLLPIVVTLPGPGGGIAPDTSIIDVEMIPATSPAAIIGQDDEQTAALPSAPEALPADEPPLAEDAEAQPAPDDSPKTEPGVSQGEEAIEPNAAPEDTTAIEENAKAGAAKSADAAKAPAKKSVAARRTKPAVRRSSQTPTKIAPFNGALSGLFSPGAPAKRR